MSQPEHVVGNKQQGIPVPSTRMFGADLPTGPGFFPPTPFVGTDRIPRVPPFSRGANLLRGLPVPPHRLIQGGIFAPDGRRYLGPYGNPDTQPIMSMSLGGRPGDETGGEGGKQRRRRIRRPRDVEHRKKEIGPGDKAKDPGDEHDHPEQEPPAGPARPRLERKNLGRKPKDGSGDNQDSPQEQASPAAGPEDTSGSPREETSPANAPADSGGGVPGGPREASDPGQTLADIKEDRENVTRASKPPGTRIKKRPDVVARVREHKVPDEGSEVPKPGKEDTGPGHDPKMDMEPTDHTDKLDEPDDGFDIDLGDLEPEEASETTNVSETTSPNKGVMRKVMRAERAVRNTALNAWDRFTYVAGIVGEKAHDFRAGRIQRHLPNFKRLHDLQVHEDELRPKVDRINKHRFSTKLKLKAGGAGVLGSGFFGWVASQGADGINALRVGGWVAAGTAVAVWGAAHHHRWKNMFKEETYAKIYKTLFTGGAATASVAQFAPVEDVGLGFKGLAAASALLAARGVYEVGQKKRYKHIKNGIDKQKSREAKQLRMVGSEALGNTKEVVEGTIPNQLDENEAKSHYTEEERERLITLRETLDPNKHKGKKNERKIRRHDKKIRKLDDEKDKLVDLQDMWLPGYMHRINGVRQDLTGEDIEDAVYEVVADLKEQAVAQAAREKAAKAKETASGPEDDHDEPENTRLTELEEIEDYIHGSGVDDEIRSNVTVLLDEIEDTVTRKDLARHINRLAKREKKLKKKEIRLKRKLPVEASEEEAE